MEQQLQSNLRQYLPLFKDIKVLAEYLKSRPAQSAKQRKVKLSQVKKRATSYQTTAKKLRDQKPKYQRLKCKRKAVLTTSRLPLNTGQKQIPNSANALCEHRRCSYPAGTTTQKSLQKTNLPKRPQSTNSSKLRQRRKLGN